MNDLVVDPQALQALSERHHLQFVTLFGSSAREGRGRDVDIAVLGDFTLNSGPDAVQVWEELSDLLSPSPVDVAVLDFGSWLLNWQVARDGKCLWGHSAFERFCEAAYWRRTDAGWWRGEEKAYLARFLKREVTVDWELLRRRLAMMSQYLGELEMVLANSEAEFLANPLLLRTAERDTELLVECAAKINTALGQLKGIPPSDYYSSFFALAPDYLDRELLTELARLARLRNLLVHQYEDVQPFQVYAACRKAAPLWRAYLEGITRRLDAES